MKALFSSACGMQVIHHLALVQGVAHFSGEGGLEAGQLGGAHGGGKGGYESSSSSSSEGEVFAASRTAQGGGKEGGLSSNGFEA